MHGDKVSGGYEAAFVHTEQHRDVALAAIQERDWFKRRFSKYDRKVHEDRQGKVRAKAVKSRGFMNVKGWRIVVPTMREYETVQHTAEWALLALFKEGDRVRTVCPLHRWGKPDPRPEGTMGTVVRIESGDLYVRFDGDPVEWNCAPWWFEVAA